MTGRGKGKYTYKQELRKKGEEHIGKLLKNILKIIELCILVEKNL